MSDAEKRLLEAGRQRLDEIERRIGPFMPKTSGRDGVKRGEWRSDESMIRGAETKAAPVSKKRA